jgi:hypothetical protein
MTVIPLAAAGQLLPGGFVCAAHSLPCLPPLPACSHPGNLLRTPDGKICVLDFGLMTEVRRPGGLLALGGISLALG